MDEPKGGLLRVPGATLYYKVQGTGPLLLMLQGGDGDADATDALAAHLVERYTLLSYERRGLSRSPLDDPSAAPDLSTHGDDASRLLQAVTDEPAMLFGASFGALLGLELVSRHPEQVRLLVAHEPPATELLPEHDRERAVRGQEEVEQLYRREGIAAALRKFVAITGIDHDDREPDVDLAGPKPERIANLDFFLANDRAGRPPLPPRPRGTARRCRPDRCCGGALARERLRRQVRTSPRGGTRLALRGVPRRPRRVCPAPTSLRGSAARDPRRRSSSRGRMVKGVGITPR